MYESLKQALSAGIKEHIDLYKTRQETLILLIGLILKTGTVSLWRLAAYAESRAKNPSVHRRFERFFQHIRLNGYGIARLVVHMMNLGGKPWHLALDRTDWKLGKTHINILMLGVVVGKVCVPLFWTVLDKAGNSKTSERTELLAKLREAFPDQPIASLIADREFVGEDWINWLEKNQIPFVLRIKANMYIWNNAHIPVPLSTHAQNLKIEESRVLKGTWRLGKDQENPGAAVKLAMMRLKTGELLIVVANRISGKKDLAIYRKRWGIETLFSCLKSRGLGLEDTHMTDPAKLETLLGVLAIAFVLAYKAGLWGARFKPPKTKAHGGLQRSIFTIGLNVVRKILATFRTQQIFDCFRALASPNIPRNPLIEKAL